MIINRDLTTIKSEQDTVLPNMVVSTEEKPSVSAARDATILLETDTGMVVSPSYFALKNIVTTYHVTDFKVSRVDRHDLAMLVHSIPSDEPRHDNLTNAELQVENTFKAEQAIFLQEKAKKTAKRTVKKSIEAIKETLKEFENKEQKRMKLSATVKTTPGTVLDLLQEIDRSNPVKKPVVHSKPKAMVLTEIPAVIESAASPKSPLFTRKSISISTRSPSRAISKKSINVVLYRSPVPTVSEDTTPYTRLATPVLTAQPASQTTNGFFRRMVNKLCPCTATTRVISIQPKNRQSS